MASKLVYVSVTAVLLGFLITGCGGSATGGAKDGAPGADGVATDGGPDGGGDAVSPEDGGGDAVAPEDGGGDGGAPQAHEFLCETSGGSRASSASYRLELFFAPVPPVGGTTSANYRLQLGPGAARNAR